jgi:hypothetical protein
MKPKTPEGVFERSHRTHFDHGRYCFFVTLSFIRAALPLRSRRK